MINNKFKNVLALVFLFILFSCQENKNENLKIKEKFEVVHNSKYLSQDQLLNFVDQVKSKKLPNGLYELPFKNLQFNKVIAYDFDGDEEKYSTVIDKKTNLYNPIVLRQKALNKLQIENLISFLTNNKTYGEGTAACFVPHLALIFYQNDTCVYEVDICLDCNYLQATTEIPASYTKTMKLEDGSEIDLKGFTKTGKMEIINLCKELELDYANYK